MRFNLFPDEEIPCVYDLDFALLYDRGYRGIIFDIDNTLVPHNASADARSKELFKKLSDIGFVTLILSNNKEERVKTFSDSIGADFYIYKAGKPARRGYRDAMKKMATDTDTTLFIGDQIFTDIWGAKKSGIYSILTSPIDKWHEEIQIILKRVLEAPIICLFHILNGTKRRL